MKNAYYHANNLANYGILVAGTDPDPLQKRFGADCIEAAIILLGITDEAYVKVGDTLMCDKDLLEKAEKIRERAEQMLKRERENRS